MVARPAQASADARLDRVLTRVAPELREAIRRGWESWRAHRAAEPEHAFLLTEVCLVDAGVLPRRHPEDRGWRRDRSAYRVQAPDGAYARVPAWRTRAHWLATVVPVALGLHGDVLRRHRVSASLMRRWAQVKSGYAWSNGRCVVVRPDVLASVLDVTERQVQRLNAAARELGLEVVVLVGRMLTYDERKTAYLRGSRQRGLATEVALTIPHLLSIAVGWVTPSGGTSSHPHLTPESPHPDAASGETKDGAARRASKKRGVQVRGPAWHLGRALLTRLPWLDGESPGRLGPTLTRFAKATHPWSVDDVVDALALREQRLGLRPVDPDRIRTRPVVLLASMLRELDPYADHPRLQDLEPDTPVTTPVACAREGCDHGWITIPREGRSPAVEPCPHCPPAVRANPHPDDLMEF